MSINVASITRRAIGLAFATTMLAGAVASAATPAGDTFDADFDFRDDPGVAVLAVYPYSTDASQLHYFRVKGPEVGWIDSHPLPHGAVAWVVIVQSADSKSGPWVKESQTARRYVSADKVGKLERFKNRNVDADEVEGRFVRVVSRLIWVNEDGGKIGTVSHTYTRYGLVETTGAQPAFGDQTATRNGGVPQHLVN